MTVKSITSKNVGNLYGNMLPYKLYNKIKTRVVFHGIALIW